jgi:recombination protein RecA
MTSDKISFEDIMASLDKDTKSKIRIGSDIGREVVPTASIALNQLLGGGFRKGKQHTLWGGEQSAKTGLMMQTAAINQARGENIAWIDAEHSFDPAWARRLGLDPDRVAVSEVSTIAETTDLQVQLIKKGFDLIVIDSTSALMPKSYMDDGEIKPFGNTGQLGQVAKDLGQMCKMIQGINYTCAIVHISQARVDVGSSATTKPFKPVGGKEVEHTDSLRIRLSSSKAEAKALMGDIQRGNNIVQEKIGIPVAWNIQKNKINGRYGTGKYDFYIGGDRVGLDSAGELLDLAVNYGYVEASGAWFVVDGTKVQGRHKAVAYVRDNPAFAKELEVKVLESV